MSKREAAKPGDEDRVEPEAGAPPRNWKQRSRHEGPSPPSLKDHLGRFPNHILDKICSDEHLAKLTDHFSDWVRISTYLGLTVVEQDDIRATWPHNPKNQRWEMFKTWKRKKAEKATYKCLIIALHEAKNANLIDELCKIVTTATSSSIAQFRSNDSLSSADNRSITQACRQNEHSLPLTMATAFQRESNSTFSHNVSTSPLSSTHCDTDRQSQRLVPNVPYTHDPQAADRDYYSRNLQAQTYPHFSHVPLLTGEYFRGAEHCRPQMISSGGLESDTHTLLTNSDGKFTFQQPPTNVANLGGQPPVTVNSSGRLESPFCTTNLRIRRGSEDHTSLTDRHEGMEAFGPPANKYVKLDIQETLSLEHRKPPPSRTNLFPETISDLADTIAVESQNTGVFEGADYRQRKINASSLEQGRTNDFEGDTPQQSRSSSDRSCHGVQQRADDFEGGDPRQRKTNAPPQQQGTNDTEGGNQPKSRSHSRGSSSSTSTSYFQHCPESPRTPITDSKGATTAGALENVQAPTSHHTPFASGACVHTSIDTSLQESATLTSGQTVSRSVDHESVNVVLPSTTPAFAHHYRHGAQSHSNCSELNDVPRDNTVGHDSRMPLHAAPFPVQSLNAPHSTMCFSSEATSSQHHTQTQAYKESPHTFSIENPPQPVVRTVRPAAPRTSNESPPQHAAARVIPAARHSSVSDKSPPRPAVGISVIPAAPPIAIPSESPPQPAVRTVPAATHTYNESPLQPVAGMVQTNPHTFNDSPPQLTTREPIPSASAHHHQTLPPMQPSPLLVSVGGYPLVANPMLAAASGGPLRPSSRTQQYLPAAPHNRLPNQWSNTQQSGHHPATPSYAPFQSADPRILAAGDPILAATSESSTRPSTRTQFRTTPHMFQIQNQWSNTQQPDRLPGTPSYGTVPHRSLPMLYHEQIAASPNRHNPCFPGQQQYPFHSGMPTPSSYHPQNSREFWRNMPQNVHPSFPSPSFNPYYSSVYQPSGPHEYYGMRMPCEPSLQVQASRLSTQPTTDPSPVVQRYGTHLRNRYRIQRNVCIDKDRWPPVVIKKVFKLAMITNECIQHGRIKDEFVRLTITGSLDDILQMKVPVELENILTSVTNVRKVILIEGAPGSGKSTLCLDICQKWEAGKLFQEYVAVILVRLRDPAVQKAKSIKDLLPRQTDRAVEEVSSEICASGGMGILWILDGWDEFPSHLQEDSVIRHLIAPELNAHSQLINSSVIITSRPISSGHLHPLVSVRIEVLGYTPEIRKQYFEEALDGNEEAAETLQNKIGENPAVESSCYLPLNAAIMLHLFLCSGDHSLPNTHYGIFSALVCNSILRHLKERMKQNITEIVSLDHLPEIVQGPFHSLCKLAYHGVMENKLTFSQCDLSMNPENSEINTLGLLQGVESLVSTGKHTYYNFLHLSIQELLAAYHIATQLSPEEQVSKFQAMFHDDRFSAVFRFYAAITKLQTPGINSVITSVIQRKYYRLLVSLLNCLYEVQDPSLCKFVSEQLEDELDLSYTSLSSVDCLSVGYFLSSVCITTSGVFNVNLESCSINQEGCKFLMRGLSRCLDPHTTSTAKLNLNLWRNTLSSGGLESVTELLRSSDVLYGLKLDYKEKDDDGQLACSVEAMKSLLDGVPHSSSLVELNLVGWYVDITKDNGSILGQLLKEQQTLQVLELDQWQLCDTGASYIADGLKHNNTLKRLTLDHCGITSSGMESLSSALTENTTLETLDVARNKFGDTGAAIHLGNALRHNHTLKSLNLEQCGITSSGMESLSLALIENTTLETLDVSVNKIGDTGAEHLGNALKHNNTLKSLTLMSCDITSSGMESLSLALIENTTLETLDVSKNEIGDTGAEHLGNALKHNNTLKSLTLMSCDITSSGMESLSLALIENTTLEKFPC